MLLLQIFVAETGGRGKLLLPFSWWSGLDMEAAGSYTIIFTLTIIINTITLTYDKIFQYNELWARGGAVG
jgi:hypothetical protein